MEDWKTREVVNTESVHRNAIIMAPISLTKSNRFTKETTIHLKKLYDGIEFTEVCLACFLYYEILCVF